MKIRFGFFAVCSFLFFLSGVSSGQQIMLPETLYIPVTFYDFHSDSSNPEFEITPDPAQRRTDMVDDRLDEDGKPVVGEEPYFNRRIDRWFRPWESGDFEIYNYVSIYPERYYMYNTYNPGRTTINHDTSFINMVIEDSLPFILFDATTATYQFADNSFFPLDGRGFGNEGRSHNYSFTMELHYPFTKIPGLSFEFTGDDDVWAFVDSTLRMDIGGIHGPVSDAFDLDREPDLVDNYTYSLDFFYVERHVTGSNIKITTNILSPPITVEVDAYPSDTICPYTPVTLRADVSDDFFGERPDLAQNAIWRVTDYNGQDSSCLQPLTGPSVTFTANVAYSKVEIEVRVPNGSDTISAYITLYIEPCEAYKIYIEASDVNPNDTNALRYPQELGSIQILSDMTSNDAYAIARDSSGAYVRLADANITTWEITPDGASFASAAGEDGRKYHGVVTRTGQEGNTFAVATEEPLLPDSVAVVIASYYIVRYQLRDSITGEIIHSITMNSDQSRAYQSWGLKSTATDTNAADAWILAEAKWTLESDSIEVRNPTPDRSNHWFLDPTSPGSGTIVLNNPDDDQTQTLEIPVTITRAAPSGVKISLISPPPRRAGDTLLFKVEITNGDGLVPGEFCFGDDGNDTSHVSYSDNLGYGGVKPVPTIQINGNDTLLNILNQKVYHNNQCFEQGTDTVKVVLYYAPFVTDSLHQVSVTLNPQLTASSEKFILLPNELDSIVITDVNFVPLEPQTLTGSESVTPYSTGFDRYGNLIDLVDANWSSTGTLEKIDERGKQTYVSADKATTDQAGNVCATEKRKSDGSEIKACLHITIIGPKKQVTSAITQDRDGDGYLDGIRIVFDRRVGPDQISTANFINISVGARRFTPETITQIDTSTYLLTFTEIETDAPQTNWRPYFDIVGSSAVGDTLQVVTTDGAGPVIWRVEKDVEHEQVRVTLSEPVRNVSGNDMQISDSPELTFNTYRKLEDGTFDTLQLLEGITTFTRIIADSILDFNISNGKDLSAHHYVNLEVYPPVVQDYVFNTPHIDNIKRKVIPVGQKDSLILAPNPTSPSFLHTGPGSLALNSDQRHVDWARQRQGALIRVFLTPDSMMSATIKIYDMVGNLVAWSHQQDFLTYLKNTNSLENQEEASVYQLDHYWNGSNQQGMKVAPGLYRVVYYVDYRNSALSDIKLIKILGISK